jgi:hypothetical protein
MMIVSYSRREPPVPVEALDRLERRIGMTLPAVYRDYLLAQDGGRLSDNSEALKTIFGLGKLPKWTSLWEVLKVYAGRLPPWLLPVADDEYGNLFAISLRHEDPGSVWFWDHEEEADEDEPPTEDNIRPLAPDWVAFLDSLEPVASPPDDDIVEACISGDLAGVKSFVAAGGDVNSTGQYGQALIEAAAGAGQNAVVGLLIESGADMGQALFHAARNGRAETVEALISQGAVVDQLFDDRGDTPLMTAAAFGHYDTVEILLKHGANVSARNKYEQTAAQQAGWADHDDIIELLRKAGAA